MNDNNPSATTNKLKHTHPAYNSISTSMMKTLLDEDQGLTNMLMDAKTRKADDQSHTTAIAVVKTISDALWSPAAGFPCHLLGMGRILYSMMQGTGSHDWAAVSAKFKIDVKLSAAKSVWPDLKSLEDCL